MKEYEIVITYLNGCAGDAYPQISFDEAELQDPADYVRKKHGKDFDKFVKSTLDDGRIVYTYDNGTVTYIKMDVEGAELDALHGAKETILRNHPKLAICFYHYQRDFVEIQKWIHSLVPEYKLYIRHHSFSVNETVLYAIPPTN